MKRRDFFKTMGLGAASLVLPGCLFARKQNAPKPNIILIHIDDMGWTDLECFGSRYYETPNIDRLAGGGMKFTNAYAACAVCSPTRAALMTGRYPARLGITDWIRPRGTIRAEAKNPTGYDEGKNKKLLCPKNALWMELDEITIAEVLKPAGYATCHIGKWHLGPDNWYPDKQGFDYNIGGCHIGQPPSYFDPYGKRQGGGIQTLKPRSKGEYLTDREGDEAVSFIKNHSSRPFFLHLAHYAVHTPIQAKKEIVAKYKTKKPTKQKNPIYAAMVESVDDAVGKVMAALDETNLTKQTIIIFTSDNGGLVGTRRWSATDNAPLRAGKGYPYEGGIRVPLIVRWPGVVKADSLCDEPVISVDYFPTICRAVGENIPADRAIDGQNLVPLLKQTGTLKRNAIFWHFPHYRGGDVVPYSIVRAGAWKLIKRYEGKTFELFNLHNDISEKNDLSTQMPEKVKELDAILAVWLRDTGARMPVKNEL